MRVAYLVNRYPGASHSFIRREIRALEAHGLTVLRYSLRPAGPDLVDEEDIEEAGRTRTLLAEPARRLLADMAAAAIAFPAGLFRSLSVALKTGWRSERGLVWHVFYWGEAAVLARRLRLERADHLHAHFGTNSATVAMLAGELTGIPWSFTVHGPDEFDRPEAIALGQKIARARFVCAVSSFGRSQLLRWAARQDWPKVRIVRCGLDAAYVKAVASPVPAAPRLLSVARLSAQKGTSLLIEAAAALRASGTRFELRLVGDGPLRAELEEEIAARGLGDCVRITGWLSGEAVRQEIESCRALVLASFAEGLPVVLMEAMALARPVIATFVAGIPELVVPRQTGWLAPAGDAPALAAAMKEALEADPAVLARMGEAGREQVLRRHNAAMAAAALERLFLEAAP